MKKGFTLIELLVVVLIIGILSAVALPQYQLAVEKSRISEALAIGKTLEQAMTVWVLNRGGYPSENIEFLGTDGNDELDISLPLTPFGETTSDSKHFRYDAWCGGYGDQYCRWGAARLGVNYRIVYENYNGKEGYTCQYDDTEGGLAEKVCNAYKAQGWSIDYF